jgi:hypothetical protein
MFVGNEIELRYSRYQRSSLGQTRYHVTKVMGLDVEVQMININSCFRRDRYGFPEPLDSH